MLRPFQVNVGCYLTLNQDVLPTAKVAELCTAIEAVGGERAGSQVLLAADGRQMDPQDLVGNYSVGTEDKPLFVFYRSYISTSEPPSIPSRVPQRGGGLQRQLEILRQRPSPSLFQHQVALSKYLCEYSVELEGACELLTEEHSLQLSGWKTVLSNCGNLIGMFQKHHQLFCKTVERFRGDKPRNLDLLQKFPEQVQLLQKLPLPSSLSSSTAALSLYDWISTHDEKNSLMDLSAECKKALEKVDSEQLEKALLSSQEIQVKRIEVFDSENQSLERVGERLKSDCLELQNHMETIIGLGKNIQSTSEKAMHSGDAKTIAVLVESHHKSLHLMAASSGRLETIARAAEEARRELTRHIHTKLRQVMELQKRVAECNGRLVLLHEHMKLAHKRFEILEQVSSTPEVLVEVCGEVSRRRAYNTALEKVMEDVISRLHQARLEEKRLRKSFQSSSGVHFVTTLFPELQDRVPDITFHSPKSLTKTYNDNLEAICSLFPEDVRASTQLATSLQLLTQPFPRESSELPISPRAAHLDDMTSDPSSPGDSWKLVGNVSPSKSPRKSPSHEGSSGSKSSSHSAGGTKTPSHSAGECGGNDSDVEKLKEHVGKLELTNVKLSSKLQQSLQKAEAVQVSMAERDLACLDATQKLRDSEELLLTLQQTVAGLERSKAAFAGEKSSHVELVKELELKAGELEERLAMASKELQERSLQCTQLTADRERASCDMDALNDRVRTLQREHSQASCKLEEHCAELQEKLSQAEALREKGVQTLQALLCKSDSENQQLAAAKEALELRESALETRLHEMERHRAEQETLLSELQEKWEEQRQSAEREVERYRAEQELEREALSKHSALYSSELSVVREQLRKESQALELCRVELSTAKTGHEASQTEARALREEVRVVQEELSRQQQRCQQAQASMNSNRAQLEALDARRKTLAQTLDEREVQWKQVTSDLDKARQLAASKEHELNALKDKHSAELRELLAAESGRTSEARNRISELENSLNQQEAELNEKEKKLSSAKQRIDELQVDLSKKKEKLLSADGRLQQTEQEFSKNRNKLQSSKVEVLEKARQQDELEHRMQAVEAKLQETVRGQDAKMAAWSLERDGYVRQVKALEGKEAKVTELRDSYIKQVMELEREVKELKRDAGQSSPPSSSSASPRQAIHRMSSSAHGLDFSAAGPDQMVVYLRGFQIGQVALFMCDHYGNYLALSTDGKTYYLDGESVHGLQDLAARMPHLKLKWKILVGRITGRLYMEVRKENNRLKVPVGSRLYKLQAEQVEI